MKTIILLCMCVAGSLANGYGSVSVSYGQNTPAVVTYGEAPASPIRAALRSSYSAPAPAAPVVPSYAAPAPAAPVQSYSAPAPAAPVPSYSAPATPVQSYVAPAAPVQSYVAPAAPVQSYSAPAPAAPVQSYSAPAPATPVQSYSAPAPASPAYGSSYGASNDQVVAPIGIKHFSQEMQIGSHHSHSYETEHGIRQQEHTQIHMNSNGNSDEHMITKKGSYSYLSPEGQTISMEYVADETGFHPKGDHLPVAPENTLEVVQAIREFEAAYELAAKANPESAQNNGYISPSNY